jgi:hypothetical protein
MVLASLTGSIGVLATGGCSSDKAVTGTTGTDGGTCKAPGGPVTGAADDHCQEADGGKIAQVTGACVTESLDAGSGVDAGAPAGDDYGPTHFGSEAFDDDCKYRVSWTSSPICENNNVLFTITASKTVGGGPLTGSGPYIEYYKVESDGSPHFTANPPEQATTEKAGGVYDMGPLSFDESGQWLVRFHFYGECDDLPEDSPHGHAAFYVNVP